MPDLLQVYDEATIESFDETALREAALVAELAVNGVIPAYSLPKLHLWMDGEKPQLVSTAMENLSND